MKRTKAPYKLPSLHWLTDTMEAQLKTSGLGYKPKFWLCLENDRTALALSPTNQVDLDQLSSPEEIIAASRPEFNIGLGLNLLRRYYGKDGIPLFNARQDPSSVKSLPDRNSANDPRLRLIDTIPHGTADPAMFGYSAPVPGARLTLTYWCGHFETIGAHSLMVLDDTEKSHVLLDITIQLPDSEAWIAAGLSSDFHNILFRPDHQPRADERDITVFDAGSYRREFIVLELARTIQLGLFNPEVF